MTTIITANVKGGVGKTTTAVQLALHAAAVGRRTLLIDADPGRSALSWATRAPDWPHERVPVIAHHEPDLPRRLPGLAAGFDLTVIDTPHDPSGGASVGPMLASALAVADLLVVPTSPAPADLDRLADLVDAVARERARRDLDWLIALTRVDLRSRAAASEVADAMFTRELPVLGLTTYVGDPGDRVVTATWVPERGAVKRAFGSAQVLIEYSGLATAVLARVARPAEVTR
jgi:cellulose biosynthesis protein BcsQ